MPRFHRGADRFQNPHPQRKYGFLSLGSEPRPAVGGVLATLCIYTTGLACRQQQSANYTTIPIPLFGHMRVMAKLFLRNSTGSLHRNSFPASKLSPVMVLAGLLIV